MLLIITRYRCNFVCEFVFNFVSNLIFNFVLVCNCVFQTVFVIMHFDFCL